MKYCGDNDGLARSTTGNHIYLMEKTDSKKLIPREKLVFKPTWNLNDLFTVTRRLNRFAPLIEFDPETGIIID